jgi:copper chaperone CopZ
MKKTIMFITIMLAVVQLNAQFTKATLQATGLTCAMCSNAINKALQAKPFIQSVKADIKNSSFSIVFKQDADFEIDEIRKAVEDAGFGVGNLKLTGNFNQVKIGTDAHAKIGERHFHFLNTSEQTLNGEQTVTIIDKDFLTPKQFKKFKEGMKTTCLQSGKSDSCCPGVAAGTRIYHVTI